ncbi:MAG: hypothetical protein F2813_07335, partial [Actinobacteria bacterium]|nr:hypothetical protein [Actinomycetota bacterium]
MNGFSAAAAGGLDTPPTLTVRRSRAVRLFLVSLLAAIAALFVAPLSSDAATLTPLKTQGSKIVDSAGNQVVL